MKTITVTIQGTAPLLMHRFPLEPIPGLDKLTPAEAAEHAAYRVPAGLPNAGNLHVPGEALRQALVAAGAYSKGKGRANLTKTVAAGLFVSPEYCDLGTADYLIDSRPVVIQATRGRIMRHRPRIETGWRVTFQIEYDPTLLSATQVRQLVDDAGSRVGVLDFRPATKGPFGRFTVVSWDAQ